jgi:hypothetical protein
LGTANNNDAASRSETLNHRPGMRGYCDRSLLDPEQATQRVGFVMVSARQRSAVEGGSR